MDKVTGVILVVAILAVIFAWFVFPIPTITSNTGKYLCYSQKMPFRLWFDKECFPFSKP